MQDRDEMIDVIDEKNQVIDVQPKSIVHHDGLRHRVSAVLLQDDVGRFLIPTASSEKVEAGRLYHSAAGHVESGEEYRRAAKREVQEELGLVCLERDLEYLGFYWFEQDYTTRYERERFEVYRLLYVPSMGEIVLNEEQLHGKWMSDHTLRDIYDTHRGLLSLPLCYTCQHILWI